MNQRYKVWTPQGRIPDKFTVLEEPKRRAKPHIFPDFFIQWLSLLQWVHATYKAWLKIENMKNTLNNKTLNKSWFGLKLAYPK